MIETSTGWPAARILAPDFARARSLILGSAAGIPVVAAVASKDRLSHVVLCPFCGVTHAHGGWGSTSRFGAIDGQARHSHCSSYEGARDRRHSLFGEDREPYYVLKEVPGRASFHEDPDAGRTFWKLRPDHRGVLDAVNGLGRLIRDYEEKWSARIERDGTYITTAEVVAKTRPPKATMTARVTRAISKRDVPAAVERAVLGDADACHYCSDVLLPRQVEHYRPLARGGTNARGNLVAACISCNTQKRAMLVHEWRQWRTSNGMSWPPVASHAVDPRHYRSVCRDCQRADRRAGKSDPSHYWRVVPYRMDVGPHGYRTRHRCPLGHSWTFGRNFDTTYFSDCPCPYCVTCCLEDGVEVEQPMTFWTVAA